MKIVCLANSRKLAGRCIAGKVIEGENAGSWVRPVSGRPHEEVSEHERQYPDGSDPKVLDIIHVPLLGPKPSGYQKENWLLDPKEYWVKRGQLPVTGITRLVERPPTLWLNHFSSYNGANDRIPLTDAEGLQSSLTLVEVEDLSLHVYAPGEAFGNAKRRVQGDFTYNGVHYSLWVTDPRVERLYLGGDNGTYELGHRYLCVSLGEPHEGYCYKLIASVIRTSETLQDE